MTTRTRTIASLAVGALLLTGCATDPEAASGDTATGDEVAADETQADDEMSDASEDGAHDDASDPEADDGSDVAATGVLGVTATAPDGSTFSIADHVGQPILVETFATWCSTCRRQLGATQQAAVEAGDDAVFLILSVETTIDPAALAEYAEQEGFGALRFGVLDEQGLATLEAAFGRSVLNPPSTPKFRVSGDGELSELTTGLESAEEILATLASA